MDRRLGNSDSSASCRVELAFWTVLTERCFYAFFRITDVCAPHSVTLPYRGLHSWNSKTGLCLSSSLLKYKYLIHWALSWIISISKTKKQRKEEERVERGKDSITELEKSFQNQATVFLSEDLSISLLQNTDSTGDCWSKHSEFPSHRRMVSQSDVVKLALKTSFVKTQEWIKNLPCSPHRTIFATPERAFISFLVVSFPFPSPLLSFSKYH